jgi:hypothetical protein
MNLLEWAWLILKCSVRAVGHDAVAKGRSPSLSGSSEQMTPSRPAFFPHSQEILPCGKLDQDSLFCAQEALSASSRLSVPSQNTDLPRRCCCRLRNDLPETSSSPDTMLRGHWAERSRAESRRISIASRSQARDPEIWAFCLLAVSMEGRLAAGSPLLSYTWPELSMHRMPYRPR